MWSLFQAIKRSWSEHFITQFTSFLVVTMALLAVLVMGLALDNTGKILDRWGRITKLTVYLKESYQESDLENLKQFVASSPLTESYELVPANVVAQKFNRTFSQLSGKNIEAEKIEKFFPAIVEIQIDKTIQGSQSRVSALAGDLSKKHPFVSRVTYGKNWLNRYSTILGSIASVSFLIMGLLMMGAFIACASVVKTMLHARGDEIEILELIGANRLAIYLPQLTNVLSTIVVAFVVSLCVAFSLFYHIQEGDFIGYQVKESMEFLSFWQLTLLFSVLVGGSLLYSVFAIYQLLPATQKKQMRGLF